VVTLASPSLTALLKAPKGVNPLNGFFFLSNLPEKINQPVEGGDFIA